MYNIHPKFYAIYSSAVANIFFNTWQSTVCAGAAPYGPLLDSCEIGLCTWRRQRESIITSEKYEIISANAGLKTLFKAESQYLHPSKLFAWALEGFRGTLHLMQIYLQRTCVTTYRRSENHTRLQCAPPKPIDLQFSQKPLFPSVCSAFNRHRRSPRRGI